jgi:hypothetical protein
MARLALIQPSIAMASPNLDSTILAFRYLYWFRRIVVGLAVAGGIVAFLEQWSGLGAACVCIGIGEWLECSYYLNVLRWRQDGAAADSSAVSSSARGSSQATSTSTSTVTSTPTKTA